jgi:hypothetical protein
MHMPGVSWADMLSGQRRTARDPRRDSDGSVDPVTVVEALRRPGWDLDHLRGLSLEQVQDLIAQEELTASNGAKLPNDE